VRRGYDERSASAFELTANSPRAESGSRGRNEIQEHGNVDDRPETGSRHALLLLAFRPWGDASFFGDSTSVTALQGERDEDLRSARFLDMMTCQTIRYRTALRG
jgi:hypothetical protein